MPANFNVGKKPASYHVRKERRHARKGATRKTASSVDMCRNALEAVQSQNRAAITNRHQSAAMKSNPHALVNLTKKKMKVMRKRILIADKASGELKPAFVADTKAMTE